MKTRINNILQRYREFLRTDEFEEKPILTAYVNLDPTDPDNRKDRPAWLIELKNEAKRLEEELEPEKLKRRATQNKWANTEEVVTGYINQHPPLGRSAVIFSDHSDFVAVDLPLPTKTRLCYGLPQMKEMLSELDQYFRADPDAERLILGGNLKVAHAVKNALHPFVRNKLVAIEGIDFKASENGVAEQVRTIADQFELEHDLTVVDDLVARYNRDGSAVVERQGVETALSRGLAKTVVIPCQIASSEFDSLILQATMTGAEIEFVYEEAAEKLDRFGGVGATLYHA